MRQHTNELADALQGSFSREVTVNVFHGTERVAEGLRFVGWSLDADFGAEICYSGSGSIVVDSAAGESWSPDGTRGLLSPFRAKIEIVMTVSAGDFEERVSLGMMRLVRAPSMRDYTATVNGVEQVVASHAQVVFLSEDETVRRAGFRFPSTSPSGASVWGEIRRLSRMPVEETVPDTSLSSAVTWEAAQGSRLKAVHELGKRLGGTVVVNSRGALVIVPDEYGEPVGALKLGQQGTVTEIDADVDTDGVYNVVVGMFEDDNRNPIFSVATVDTGDLAPGGLYGENVRYYSSDFVKTQLQADRAVRAVLAESISTQMYHLPVQCHINPLVEIGDVWAVEGWVRPVEGRVVKVSMSDSELMNVTLRVKRNLA